MTTRARRPVSQNHALVAARMRVTEVLDKATGPMKREQYARFLEAVSQEVANRSMRLAITDRGAPNWRRLFGEAAVSAGLEYRD